MPPSALAIAPKSYARIAGILYLVIAVFGAFAIGYVPSVIVVAGDAAATATNLLANPGLFGMGVFADVVVMLAEIVLTVMLFVLFRPVSPTLSLVAMVARLLMVAVMAVNALLNVLPMLLLTSPAAQATFDPSQLEGTALFLIEAHQYGIQVWGVLFGTHLAVLGYLIARSGYFPRLLGIGALVGSFGYTIEGLQQLTFLDSAVLSAAVAILLVIATLSELGFAFWLLIRGLDLSAWNRSVPQAA